jgi:hypothetical protein
VKYEHLPVPALRAFCCVPPDVLRRALAQRPPWKTGKNYILEETIMKKRILSLALALMMCATLAVPAFAATAPKIIQSVTIEIPEPFELRASLTNIADQFLLYPDGVWGGSAKSYVFFYSTGATYSFNRGLRIMSDAYIDDEDPDITADTALVFGEPAFIREESQKPEYVEAIFAEGAHALFFNINEMDERILSLGEKYETHPLSELAAESKIVPSLTIHLPTWRGEVQKSGPVVTLTNVYDYAFFSARGLDAVDIYTNANGTVSFDRDVTLITKLAGGEFLSGPFLAEEVDVLKAGTVYKVAELSGSLYFDNDGNFPSLKVGDELPDGTLYEFSASEEPPYRDDDATVYSLSQFAVTPSTPAPPAAPITAKPTASKVLVNGENTSFDAYNISDNNYFKLRDLAFVLNGTEKQFAIGYDEATKAITLTSGQAYTPVGGELVGKGDGNKTATPSTSKIYIDGKEASLTAYLIGGNNYFKLRDVGEAFDFGTDWDGANKTIAIDTSKGYTAE